MDMFEIYLRDLTDEAQRRYLEFQGVADPSELNAEYFPICAFERAGGEGESDRQGD